MTGTEFSLNIIAALEGGYEDGMATSNEARPVEWQTISPLIRWHGYAALASVLYVALLGLTMSIKFHAPDWLGSVPWLSWGRLRYAAHAGPVLRLAGERLPRLPLFCRASAGCSPGHE